MTLVPKFYVRQIHFGLFRQFTVVDGRRRTIQSVKLGKTRIVFLRPQRQTTYNPSKRDIVSLNFFNGEDILDNSRDGFGSSFMSGSITDKTTLLQPQAQLP
jgi:hypothetical protein